MQTPAAALPPVPQPTPPPRSPEMQAMLDAEHLRLLQISYYILAGMTILRLVWLLFMMAIFGFAGTMATFAPHRAYEGSASQPPTQIIFVVLAAIFGFIFLLTVVFIILEFYAARCLKNRRNLVAIQIVAALYCLSLPWGTAVGVCTFMVLNRPSVRVLFR